MTCRAISRWQLSASTVTIQPSRLSIFNNLGTAVISFDLASVATCASTSRCSQPQADTMCSADLPLAVSNERRSTLPSIATTPWQASANPAMKRWKQWRNCSASSRRNNRLKVSWLGAPCSNLRKPRRNPSLARANSAMSVQSSPPDSTVHSAIISISSRSWRPALPVRGSASPAKQAVKPSIVVLAW